MSDLSAACWAPLDELTWLRESIHLIAAETPGIVARGDVSSESRLPSVEVFETSTEVVVRACLPGVDPQTLRVDVSGNCISLKGETCAEPDQRGRRYHRRELRYQVFRRIVVLPSPVDAGTAKATYRHGLLEVRMDRSRRSRPPVVRTLRVVAHPPSLPLLSA